MTFGVGEDPWFHTQSKAENHLLTLANHERNALKGHTHCQCKSHVMYQKHIQIQQCVMLCFLKVKCSLEVFDAQLCPSKIAGFGSVAMTKYTQEAPRLRSFLVNFCCILFEKRPLGPAISFLLEQLQSNKK